MRNTLVRWVVGLSFPLISSGLVFVAIRMGIDVPVPLAGFFGFVVGQIAIVVDYELERGEWF